MSSRDIAVCMSFLALVLTILSIVASTNGTSKDELILAWMVTACLYCASIYLWLQWWCAQPSLPNTQVVDVYRL